MESRREAEALLGETIEGKYRIEALVGRGGFGLVYRARHLIWNQPVAIKFLTRLSNVPEEARAEVLAFFVREGRLLSELSSKTTGIVQARDIGTMTTPTGRWMPYMVLEWLEGQPLGRVLRREAAEGRTRSVLEAFRVFDGVARALAIAHQSGVAHRDIKPPNIFLCGDALEPGVTVKLLDFGIAKVMQDHSGEAFETTGGAMIFTPHYGAPEQFNRKLGVSGPWTDVYAMTLVFLELVTGARVRTGESVGELAVECMDDARRPTPRALGVEVSDAVEAVLSRALAVQIEERFQSMGALWMALAAALELEAYPPLPAAREDSVVTAAISDPGTSLTGAELSGGLSTLQALDSRGFEPVHTETVAPLPARAGPRRSVALVGGLSALVVAVTSVALLGDDPPAPAAPASSPAVVEVDEPAAPLVVTPPAAPRSPCPEGMSPITGGPFYMGTDLEDVPALAMARPAHQVTVADFCLDVREVTVAEYRACSDVGECKRAFLDSSWPQGSTPRREWKAQRAA
ncbi:MAG: protein kinase, partial [Myxococcales bacterium]|nr:protein kinase [Myxococcales bacterium]